MTPSVSAIPWIEVAPGAPYFVTAQGEAWTPVGQNDAITWPDLAGLFRRRDLASAAEYLAMLSAHGVTVLRLMLEYCQGEHRYFEHPVGRFQPHMIRLWDDLFALCERFGLRILLTPFDTFWMWRRWRKHPYNRRNGGTCERRSQMLTCSATRRAIKRRLAFATQRWGGSGALFAWDLWNEIHSAYAENCAAHFSSYIEDIGGFLRDLELRLYGRAHLQTVSLFGPHLASDACIAEAIFCHPALDFASTHFYGESSLDNPRNSVDGALSAGRLTREAISQITNDRPFFDSEHGPIHMFKNRRHSLPEVFDDEYFSRMQWAHFASGGAGGGMRWPYRQPHQLTCGMRQAQRSLAGFLPLIDWPNFRRQNWNEECQVEGGNCAVFACGDGEQAIVWLLRRDGTRRDRVIRRDAEATPVRIRLPEMRAGFYRVRSWETKDGVPGAQYEIEHLLGGKLRVLVPPFVTDCAMAIRRITG